MPNCKEVIFLIHFILSDTVPKCNAVLPISISNLIPPIFIKLKMITESDWVFGGFD